MMAASRAPNGLALRVIPALLLVAATALQAQTPAPPARRGAPGEIRGRLTETVSGAPIATGSIKVVRSGSTVTAGGALPKADGSFVIEGLANGRYTVSVRALGFSPAVRDDVVISTAHHVADLGAIRLSQVAAQISGAVVTAEREDVVLQPDRNVYSTKNMTTASGGSAIDVLRNVPSVEVDASNNVSLRGDANVVVQINGRPSPLKGDQLGNFLAQLPASTVKNVEVATNPSAKDDPEGTAGIINIVLNQDAELSLSGGLNFSGGTTGQVNGSGNIGREQGPFTWFLSYGLFTGRQTSGGSSEQTNLLIPIPASVNSRITGSSSPLWQNGAIRTQYRITPHDVLSGDAMFSGGQFTRNNTSYFSDLDADGDVTGSFDELNDGTSSNTLQDYTLAYDHNVDLPSKRQFSSTLDLTQNSNHGETDISSIVHQGTAATGVMVIPTEQDFTSGGFPRVTLQGDFTQPWSNGKLQTGLKEIERHTTNDFNAAYLDSASNIYIDQPSRATNFDYREQIGAGYAVVSQQFGKVQTQAGLRLEEADTRLELPSAAPDSQRFDNQYASAYPSAIVSYNFNALRQVKLSYSRRVSRPDPSQLSPVVFREDANTVFHGNPDLRPEYTDAFEFNLQDSHGWGTIQINPYMRRTAHAVRFIQTADTTGLMVETFDNVASSTQTGADLNITYHPGPLMLFTGGSAYHYSSNAGNLPGNLSTEATVWSARLNATWKFSPVLNAQFFANYRSPYATEGSQQRSFTYVNLAVQRKLWNNTGSVTIRVTDPFNMMTYGSIITNAELIEATQRNYGIRGIYVSFSRNFGAQLKLRPTENTDQPPAAGPTPP